MGGNCVIVSPLEDLGLEEDCRRLGEKTVKFGLIIAALCAGLAPASAQDARPSWPKKIRTTLNAIDRPLSALLNDGWNIASTGGPLLFTLSKGNKWIVCAVDDDRMMLSDGPTSECMALN
jgi:hypothetical protein